MLLTAHSLITIETLQKVSSHLKLTFCCFKVQTFIICAQYLFLQLPDTQNKRKIVKKIIYIERLGKWPYNPSTVVFLPAHSRSGFGVVNLQLLIDGCPRQTDSVQT